MEYLELIFLFLTYFFRMATAVVVTLLIMLMLKEIR